MSGSISAAYSEILQNNICAIYEDMRRSAIGGGPESGRANGHSVMVRNGFLAWARATLDRVTAQHQPERPSVPGTPCTTEIESLFANIILERLEA